MSGTAAGEEEADSLSMEIGAFAQETVDSMTAARTAGTKRFSDFIIMDSLCFLFMIGFECFGIVCKVQYYPIIPEGDFQLIIS